MLENLEKYSVLLASGSPRRRELMEMLGVDFEVVRGKDMPETWPETMAPEEVPAYLSRQKAEAFIDSVAENALVIAADTVVICDGKILGKPADEAQARQMLRQLSGKDHDVVTGVTILTRSRVETFSAKTSVTFAELTDDEINEYVERFHPLDKAGAYGIQEVIGAIAVKSIVGSYYNVMGLPIHRLYSLLKTF